MKSVRISPGAAVAVAIIAAYAAFLFHIGTAHPVAYHLTDDDYTQHSMAHGLSSEAFLRGDRSGKRDWFQLMHPGIPFQVSSWLAFRAAYRVQGEPLESVVAQAFDDPSSFWRINLLMAAVISVAGLAALALAAGRLFGSSFAPVALLVFLAHPVTVKTSYFALGNELFCALLGAAVMFAGMLALARPSALWLSAAAGALTALCYLNKLNYAAWGAGLVLGYVAALVADPAHRRQRLAGLAVFVLAAGVTAVALCEIWLGHKSIVGMAFLHLGVATKSGYYGLGSGHDVVDFAAAASAAVGFFRESVPYTILLEIVAVVPWVVRPRHGAEAEFSARGGVPALVFASAALVLSLAAAFKHYNLHYTLIAAVPAAFLAGFVWTGVRIRGRAALAALVVAASLANFTAVHAEISRLHDVQEEDLAVADWVRQLPRREGEVVVWGYRAPVPEYLDSFTLDIFPHEASRRALPLRHPGAAVGEIFTGFKPELPGRLPGSVGAARYFVFYLGERRGGDRTVRDRLAQAASIRDQPQKVLLETPRWLVLELDPPLAPAR